MRHAPIVFAWVLLFAALASAQPQFDPVPAEWLVGTRLIATDLNVLLDAPAAEWEWLISSAPAEDGPNGFKVLACRNGDGSKMFLVAVYNPFWAPLDTESAAELIAGVRHGLETSGFTVGESTHEQSNVPLPRSDRFTLQATTPDGRDVHMYGYSATSERLLQFQYASLEPTEPIEFRTFVESFELVGDVPERFPEEMTDRAGNIAFGILIFLTLAVGSVGWIVNQVGGRIVVNVWKFWLFFLCFYFVALSVTWWIYAPKSLESYEYGYIHGRVILGPAFFAALFAAWRWRTLETKRAGPR